MTLIVHEQLSYIYTRQTKKQTLGLAKYVAVHEDVEVPKSQEAGRNENTIIIVGY